MEKNSSQSVLIVITNKNRSLFCLQQKDESYWIPQYRLGYCFFGGGIKKGEGELTALKRELLEEFGRKSARAIYKNTKKLFDSCFKNIFSVDYKISLYESILTTTELKKISASPVKEGKRSILVKREEFLDIPFLLDLRKPVLDKYLNFSLS